MSYNVAHFVLNAGAVFENDRKKNMQKQRPEQRISSKVNQTMVVNM